MLVVVPKACVFNWRREFCNGSCVFSKRGFFRACFTPKTQTQCLGPATADSKSWSVIDDPDFKSPMNYIVVPRAVADQIKGLGVKERFRTMLAYVGYKEFAITRAAHAVLVACREAGWSKDECCAEVMRVSRLAQSANPEDPDGVTFDLSLMRADEHPRSY